MTASDGGSVAGPLDSRRTVTPAGDGDDTSTPSPDGADDMAFLPGETIAGRYHVRRFIAFGGMGEVYEVEDRELKEVVALKTIRADVAADGAAIERFKREILLARKVTHLNVCRIFDLGVHAPPGRPPQQFLTMELLQGETLSERVRLGRPLTVAQARPVVAQIVAALEAAHREGIVHRDLKAGNVMLCPSGRVVVTDFGLARGDESDPFTTDAGGNGGMMGSPVYMAPEQVEGGTITKAADIYALGVVMFEMLTGRVPFTGDTAMSCAVKRLKEPPPSPRAHAPDLDPLWERAILRCLEREPAARFAAARDVLAALPAPDAPAPKPEAAPVREAKAAPAAAPRRRRLALFVAAAAVLLAAAALVLRHPTPKPHAARAPATAGTRRVIAVLGFKNLSRREDVAWLSTALTEMFSTEMGAGAELRTIAGESVARTKKDLALADAESYAPDTLARIRKNLGADYVIVGAYLPLGNEFRLDVRLQSTATGETLVQIGDTGAASELPALVQRTGAQLRAKLHLGRVESARKVVSASMPRDPDAARLYAGGLAQLRVYAAAEARELLERATARAPEFPQAHAALAEALRYLGYEDRARAEAKQAFELAGRLPEEERLRVEGLYWSIAADWPRAVEAYTRLFAESPDNVEWGMRLADAQFSAGDETGGMETVVRLRALASGEDDPRIYMVLTQAAIMNQKFEEVREYAAKLAAAGEARGALSLVGEARHAQSLALWFEGRLARAIKRADQARDLAAQLGDQDGVAAALTTKAFILTERGEYGAARRAAQSALGVAARVGSRRRIWLAEHVLARCGLFGGDLASARRHYEASRRAAANVGSQYGEALALLGLAVTAATEGKLEEAAPIYARMTRGFRLFAPKHNAAFLHYFRGDLELERGDLAAARGHFTEALSLSERFHERLQAERARVGLGSVDLFSGRLVEAEGEARAAAQAFASLDLRNDRAQALALVARALAAQGRSAEAEAAAREAAQLAEGTESVFVKYDVAVARAEALTAAGKPTAALAAVEAPARDASARGYIAQALDLRLARAAAARASRLAGVGARERAGVVAEATRFGLGLLARRARALGD